jgi:myo-inositol 2-dehydrogenase / D-chiro-inositol 1-dehydrogenase
MNSVKNQDITSVVKASMSKPSIVIIGGGRMGKTRYHLCVETNVLACIGIVEPVAHHRKVLQEQGVPTYATLEEVINEIDGVWVSCPTEHHLDVILRAARYKKDIYCEKPIAFSEEDIAKCYNYCKKQGVSLYCGWNRRFDMTFGSARKAAGDNWTHLRIVNRDNPMPSPELLPQLGDIFQDFVVHDLNLAVWFTNTLPLSVFATASSSYNSGVLDNAYVVLEYLGGKTITIEASRFSPDNYDQRLEVLGSRKIEVEWETNPYSFPQRYHDAFAKEMYYFAKALRHPQTIERVNPPEHCLMTAQMIHALQTSYATKRKVFLTECSTVTLRFIGCGRFGAFMYRLLQQSMLEQFHMLEPFTRSSKFNWEKDVLENVEIEAVYICSPDDCHQAQALACIKAGKHVLVEKPVFGFKQVMQQAIARGVILMVGFHRRFDPKFREAQIFAQTHRVRHVVIESRDPVPEVDDIFAVITNSVLHDLDMLNWCFDGAAIQVEKAIIEQKSQVDMWLTIQNSQGYEIVAEIHYSRENPSYLQKITLDGQTFGYDHNVPQGVHMAEVYASAYLEQANYFFDLVRGNIAPDQNLLHSYQRSFQLLEEALKFF